VTVTSTRDAARAADETTSDSASGEHAKSSWDVLRRPFLLALGVFVVSRLCIVVAAAVRAMQLTVDLRTAEVTPGRQPAELLPPKGVPTMMTDVFTDWDGKWYLAIVTGGYPRSVPPDITFHQPEARAAFFPGYPMLVDAVDVPLPGGSSFAALFINVVLSVIAIGLLGLLALRLFDVAVATRAMMLFAIFPGSFVLSYAYAEPLFIVVALATMLLLLDDRWVLAGVFATIGTATRPNGVALVATCAVASFLAIRRNGDWSSLAAPLLAPIGVAAFHLYLGLHTGEWGVWFRVQNEAWEEGTSFGATAVTNTLGFLTDPFSSPTNAITAVTFVTMLFMLYCLWKRPLPWPMIAYIAVVIALMLVPETVTARPRFLFTAFPLFISVAAWWPRRDRYAWDLTLLACGAGLTALTSFYAVYGVIP
jgi:Gpi18-like mannosyltransferase